jgi:hypothetical protein
MELRGKANSLEQYNRKWSICINDLHLPHADKTETKDVMQTVYDPAPHLLVGSLIGACAGDGAHPASQEQ